MPDQLRKKRSPEPVYLLYFLLLSLIALRDYLEIGYSVYIITAIIAVACFFSKRETIVDIAVFLIPLSAAVNFGTIYGIMAIIYLFKALKAGAIKFRIPSYLLLAIMLFELFHYEIEPFSAGTYIAYLSVYLFLAVVFADRTMKWANLNVIKTFAFSVIVTNLLILGLTLRTSGAGISGLISDAWRMGTLYTEEIKGDYYLYNNSNNIALQCCMAIAGIIALYQEKKYSAARFVVECILLFLIGFLTISRTFLITLAAVLLWGIISNIKKLSNKKIGFIFIALMVFVAIYSMVPELINNVIFRFETGEFLASDSARYNIINHYLEYMKHDIGKILFGIGMQSHNIKAGYRYVAHNMILDVYVSWGICGLALAGSFIISLIKAFRARIKNKLQYICLIALMIFTQSGRIFRTLNVMAMFLVVIALMCEFKRTENRSVIEKEK